MRAFHRVISRTLKFIVHFIAGRDAEEVGHIHMFPVRQRHGKGLCAKQVLRGLMLLVDEQRDLVHRADHAPCRVHHVHLAVFVVRGHHQHRHRINSLQDAQILLHQNFLPKLIFALSARL